MTGQIHHYPYEARLLRPAELRREAAEERRARVLRRGRSAEGQVNRVRTRWVRAA